MDYNGCLEKYVPRCSMNTKFIRRGALLLLLVLVGIMCFMYADTKSGLFIDEIYTFGLSNNHDGPFIDSLLDYDINNKLLSRQDLLDYVTVNEGERFDFKAVYNNQANDVHPPLYYWLFNIVYSLFPGYFGIWPGFVLNLLIYSASLIFLYALLKELFGSTLVALAGVPLYGFSLIGMSTMLMIRMYVLVVMLSLALSYLVVRLMTEKKLSLYILTGLCIFLGLMTQYYFVFYAFFLCAAFVFYCLYKKDYKGILAFAVSAFAGVALMLLCFPHVFTHLFADSLVSGGNALENLSNTSQYLSRLSYYYSQVRHGLKASIIVAIAVVIVLLVFCKKVFRSFKEKKINLKTLFLLIPALVTLVLVSIISPVTDIRYVYNIVPIFVVAICMLIHWLEASTTDIEIFALLKWLAFATLVLFNFWFGRWSEPAYQYHEHPEYRAVLAEHADAPCVYLTDGIHYAISQDLPFLMIFDELFIAPSPDSEALEDYLAGFEGDKCVVYIDVSEFWSSGYDPDVMLPDFLEHSDFNEYELLYSFGLSQTYLLSK